MVGLINGRRTVSYTHLDVYKRQVISLGTRVGLAYLLAPLPAFGLNAVWWAIPIGWVLADAVGLIYYHTISRKNTPEKMSQDTPGC